MFTITLLFIMLFSRQSHIRYLYEGWLKSFVPYREGVQIWEPVNIIGNQIECQRRKFICLWFTGDNLRQAVRSLKLPKSSAKIRFHVLKLEDAKGQGVKNAAITERAAIQTRGLEFWHFFQTLMLENCDPVWSFLWVRHEPGRGHDVGCRWTRRVPSSQQGVVCLGKRWTVMRVPISQGDFSGKAKAKSSQ